MTRRKTKHKSRTGRACNGGLKKDDGKEDGGKKEGGGNRGDRRSAGSEDSQALGTPSGPSPYFGHL